MGELENQNHRVMLRGISYQLPNVCIAVDILISISIKSLIHFKWNKIIIWNVGKVQPGSFCADTFYAVLFFLAYISTEIHRLANAFAIDFFLLAIQFQLFPFGFGTSPNHMATTIHTNAERLSIETKFDAPNTTNIPIPISRNECKVLVFVYKSLSINLRNPVEHSPQHERFGRCLSVVNIDKIYLYGTMLKKMKHGIAL